LDVNSAVDGRNIVETAPSKPGEPRIAELALAIVTIERPHVVQRLITSVRKRFPAMPIYVADQSLDVGAMSSFYDHMNVTLVRMPYDAGVCASRNRLVEKIKEPAFVLCDDDFVFDGRTNFADALRILKHHPDVGVVGGRLYDYDGISETARNWELFLNLDVANRTMTSIPIYHYAPIAREMGAMRFFLCDAVMNFSVMRHSMFSDSRIRWDERFKSNGEHEDFFLNLKTHTSTKVAYLPTMVACHHHPTRFSLYRAQLRDRVDGWGRFMAKWNIDQHLEVGLGVRTKSDLTTTISADDAAARFFLNNALNFEHGSDTTDLLVTHATELAATGVLDRSGSVKDETRASARVLLRSGSHQFLAAPVETALMSASTNSRAQTTPEALRDKYRLGAQPADSLTGVADVRFRYNPRVRSDADFILWYRFSAAGRAFGREACRAQLRWYSATGLPLQWCGDELTLDPARAFYWSPLLISLPIIPAGCRVLMFHIIAYEGATRRTIAKGFVAADKRPTIPEAEPGRSDVSALIPRLSHLPPIDLDVMISMLELNDVSQRALDLNSAIFIVSLSEMPTYDALILQSRSESQPNSAIIGGIAGDEMLLAIDGPQKIAVPGDASRFQLWGLQRASGYRRVTFRDNSLARLADEMQCIPKEN
jgi:GT2 family glycosyltransferase